MALARSNVWTTLQVGLLLAGSAEAQTLEWVKPSLSTVPSARSASGIAYDVAEGSTVLFGGETISGTFYADTWLWKNGWTQQFPAIFPPARGGPAMAYDATTGTVVLFGGNNILSGGDLNDTWTWDGVTWTQQFPRVSPPPRDSAGFTYDEATRTVVLFGGSGNASGNGDVFNDTWAWDGRDKTWTQKFPTSSPSPRRTRMAYDRATRNIVLFGGDIEQYGCCDVFYGDTWTWNGVTWAEQFPSSAPAARTLNSLSYDLNIGKAVLFGGYSEPGVGMGDTWTWDGTTWTEVQTTFEPRGRWAQAVDFDPNSKALVLFGGVVSGFSAVSDTWLLVTRR